MEDMQKKNWRDMRFAASDDMTGLNSIMRGKRRTALQSLATRYKRFSLLALFFATMSTQMMQPWFMQNFAFKWPLMISYTVLMLVSSGMDYWLYRGISAIDVVAMPVAEVARRATFYRKRHLQFVAILLPAALSVVGGIYWSVVSEGDRDILVAIVTGAIIGLLIGLYALHKFMADYRDITNDN